MSFNIYREEWLQSGREDSLEGLHPLGDSTEPQLCRAKSSHSCQSTQSLLEGTDILQLPFENV